MSAQSSWQLGSSGVPESFVIDGKGVIRYQHIGEIRPDQVPLILEKLKEAEHVIRCLPSVPLLLACRQPWPQDTMPPAPYAYRQLDDPAQEPRRRR
jgi:hypothetical protein